MSTGCKKTAIVCCIALLASVQTHAELAGGRPLIELTPWAGFVTGGDFRDKFTNQQLDLDDSDAVGLNLNISASHNTSWEVDYARQHTKTATPEIPAIDVTIEKFEIGGTYEFRSDSTRPYAAMTVGASRFDPKSADFRDDTYFSFSLGGGWKFFTDRRVGVTVDARWFGTVVDEDTDVFCLSADGLVCLIQTDAGLVSQFRVSVGVNVRF